MVVASTIASFVVPVAVDVVFDKGDHVTNSDEFNGVGDGEVDKSLTSWVMLNL